VEFRGLLLIRGEEGQERRGKGRVKGQMERERIGEGGKDGEGKVRPPNKNPAYATG